MKEENGLKVNIFISALVGLTGGIILGVRDGVTVILNHAPRPFPLSEMIFFSLYPIALYALLGCLGMAVGGIIITILLRIGGYALTRTKLAGLYVGIFVFLAVSVIGSDIVGLTAIKQNLSHVAEISLVSILCGLALGALTAYILDKTGKDKLVALSISLSISMVVFLYGGLWININLLPEFWKPVSLLSDIGLFLLISLLAIGLYLLSSSVLQRDKPEAKRERLSGLSLLGAVLFAFIIISLIAHFRGENITKTEAKTTLESSTKTLVDLQDKPNIVWIVMDTTRADHLSCYGYHRKTTPNIDRIASEGVLFENAFSAAPWTLPSHASMFTGMFPGKHGTDAEHLYLDDKFQTIAEALRSYGYKTFGYSNNHWVSPDSNLSQAFDTFEIAPWGKPAGKNLDDSLLINVALRHIPLDIPLIFPGTDAGARRTNKVVRKWITDCYNAKSPFFVFINYMEVHDPYGDTPYSRDYLEESVSSAKVKGVNRDYGGYISGKVRMSNEDFDILRALYDGDMKYLDFRINQIFDYLRELKILDNTLLIITADHGENFGEHHLMSHMLCLYDTLLHVPLIIRYPKMFKPGTRIKEQVQTTDIFPTILDILEIDQDGAKEIQGHTLVQREEQGESPFAVAEHAIFPSVLHSLGDGNRSFDVSVYGRRLKAVRNDEFKYISASDGREELYNIREDPAELSNLIKTRPEKAKELRTLLNSWLGSFEHYRTQAVKEAAVSLK